MQEGPVRLTIKSTAASNHTNSTIDMERAQSIVSRALQNIQKVIVGKESQVLQALTCWMARGHLLIEDVPGTGKTMLARSIAGTVNLPFRRIQFTPDLLPGDIIGSSIYRQDQQAFEFVPGPLFTTVLLADEINRATPRTQSALLEAMSEKQITAEGRTFKLDNLFFTIGTQNPIEQLGTFPLPEAQMDRFMMRMSMGYPPKADEKKWLKGFGDVHPVDQLQATVQEEEWRWLFEQVSEVFLSDEVYEYLMNVIEKTRVHPELRIGASPRAALAMKSASQALSLIRGLNYVTPEHIYELITPVLAHRMVLTTDARLSERTTQKIVDEIKMSVAIPIRKQ